MKTRFRYAHVRSISRCDYFRQTNSFRRVIVKHGKQDLVGIWSSRIDAQMLLCAVENIREGKTENDKVVIVQERNFEGKHLSTHVLYLNEISKIHRFKKMDQASQIRDWSNLLADREYPSIVMLCPINHLQIFLK